MVPTVVTLSPLPAACVRTARELLADVDEAIERLESEDLDRERRRTLRENRHAGDRHHMCGGCSKPLRATNEICGRCGFHNDIRGRRNLGGYR